MALTNSYQGKQGTFRRGVGGHCLALGVIQPCPGRLPNLHAWSKVQEQVRQTPGWADPAWSKGWTRRDTPRTLPALLSHHLQVLFWTVQPSAVNRCS